MAEIVAAGGDAAYHVADRRSVPAVCDLADVALARLRWVDILITAAGIGWRSPLADTE